MANLQAWLDELDFDWASGCVVIRDRPRPRENWGKPRRAARHDPELLREFFDGFGGGDVAPCLAWDAKATYFVHEYDGATCLNKIYKDPQLYLSGEAEFDQFGF